jgi:hypothetical protein
MKSEVCSVSFGVSKKSKVNAFSDFTLQTQKVMAEMLPHHKNSLWGQKWLFFPLETIFDYLIFVLFPKQVFSSFLDPPSLNDYDVRCRF